MKVDRTVNSFLFTVQSVDLIVFNMGKKFTFFSSYYVHVVLSEFLHTLDLRNNAEQLLTTKCAAPKRPRKAAGHLTQDSPPSEHQIGLCAQIINDQYTVILQLLY